MNKSFKLICLPLLLLVLVSCDAILLLGALDALNDDDSEKKRPLFKVTPYSENAHPELGCAILYENANNQCSLNTLPLIGMKTPSPTLVDIEKRLLVSHHWMGQRFMVLLGQLPPDVLELMGSLTAIVIADDIRPSFYTTETGAIYLDPNYLWLTELERSAISQDQDFRSGFSNELNFTSLWRYLKPDGSLANLPNQNRTIEKLIFPLARLLYHELAHANTFFPSAAYGQISGSNNIIQAANQLVDSNIAFQLTNTDPLQSNTMVNLARVMFLGEEASARQKLLSATQVADAFASDRANDDYAYVSADREVFFEDVALLFEEFMSKHHFNYDREVAYTNASNSRFCNDYIVAWGQTGRIGDSRVKAAAQSVANQILPNANLNSSFDSLATPDQTSTSSNWCLSSSKSAIHSLDASGEDPLNETFDVRKNAQSPHDYSPF